MSSLLNDSRDPQPVDSLFQAFGFANPPVSSMALGYLEGAGSNSPIFGGGLDGAFGTGR
jgi:hypothetical protein